MDHRVLGGEFDPALYSISLNPFGSHSELSLLHEVGHHLEWRSVPKAQLGPRDFASDPRFADWLYAAYNTALVQRLLHLLEQQEEGSQTFNEIGYLLRPNELWTRSYSQYIARAASLPVLFEQTEAENKVVTGKIKYEPYWSREEFASLQQTMDVIFAELGWSK